MFSCVSIIAIARALFDARLAYFPRGVPAGSGVPVVAVAPAITGTAQVGQTLTSSTGLWTGAPVSFSYQWSNEGSPIGGATSSTYVLKTSDLGALITVAVTATNVAGASAPALSALVGPAISTTVFYVAAAGSDTLNNGTSPSTPWQTLAHVRLQTFAAGTSVLLNRGDVWREQLFISSGSSGTPIVYDAYGTGPNPIIQPSASAALTSQWTNVGGNVWTSNQTFPPAPTKLITISPANPAVVNWPSAPFVIGGLSPTAPAIAITPVGGSTLPSSIPSGVGLYLSTATIGGAGNFNVSLTPGGPLISTLGESQSGTFMGGANGYPSNNANDIGNLIWTSGGVTQTGTTNFTIFSGQLDSNLTTQGQWYFNTSDWKVHVYSTTNPATAMPGLELAIDMSAIYLVNTHNVTIQNINLQYSAATAIAQQGGSPLVATNLIYRDMIISWIGGGNLSGQGVRWGDTLDINGNSSNILMERCFINQNFDSGPNIQLFSSGTSTGVTFRNNIVAQTPAGFEIFVNSAVVSNMSIYNNTVYDGANWSAGQRWNNAGASTSNLNEGLYNGGIDSNPPTNYNIFNNVFSGLGTQFAMTQPKPAVVGGPSVWVESGTMLMDYNLWSRTDGGIPIIALVPGGTNPHLAAWINTGAVPQEAHGLIQADPQLTSPSTGNFAPALGSPLFNAGMNLFSSGVVWDINHQPRPASGPFTIGAFQ
ncbi:MAG: hypothetical protein ACREC0_04755 [Methylocella sp.]